MSAEVYGKVTNATDVAQTASNGAADILCATGHRSDLAYTVGSRAGEYAVDLVFSALREQGIRIDEDILLGIPDIIEVIADCTAHPGNGIFYATAHSIGLSKSDFDVFVGNSISEEYVVEPGQLKPFRSAPEKVI